VTRLTAADITFARKVLQTEADAILALIDRLDERFDHAIRILLERPRDWSTEALKELRAKLAARPERFTEDNLRRAYGAALADIISMVHHAADETDPLLSAEERVDKALASVIGGRALTPAQEKWLGLIRRHLIVNLAIERDDFELLEFQQEGATWKRVDGDFAGALGEILIRLNEAMAA